MATKIKRYNITYSFSPVDIATTCMIEYAGGEWCKAEDVAALEEENARSRKIIKWIAKQPCKYKLGGYPCDDGECQSCLCRAVLGEEESE